MWNSVKSTLVSQYSHKYQNLNLGKNLTLGQYLQSQNFRLAMGLEIRPLYCVLSH